MAAASAAVDELSRNFTYGALGAGNGSLSGAWYRRNQIHLFGVLLAILGNLVISISLNIQKYSHVQLAHQEHPRPYFKSMLWWAGAVLMAVGEMGNFAAYGFAPITLIAPLGCVSVTGIFSSLITNVSTTGNDNFGSLSTSIQLELIEPGSTLNVSTCLKLDDLLGMTLGFAGTYLLVNFAPNRTQSISARTVQYYFVGWQFLIYVIFEILIFCTLLYFHKRKAMKHMVILLSLVALLASLTVISVKAVSGMITFSVTDKMQLTYPIFYIMFIIMIASCVFQVKFLNHATKLYNTAMVVPINHVFFTTSAIIAGCFLSFLGVFLITRNRDKEHLPQSYIDFGNIPVWPHGNTREMNRAGVEEGISKQCSPLAKRGVPPAEFALLRDQSDIPADRRAMATLSPWRRGLQPPAPGADSDGDVIRRGHEQERPPSPLLPWSGVGRVGF
ncbi:NIPA-like protein 2 isoform X1 [Prionailurus iriomotensis]